mmetsp:Transcript_9157/g.25765  ORF Transcript_9157/g.25765 Transcript_9157/m.25765 type:complete len:312 (-) Transcript_9157:70-1005(-)
MLFTVSVFSSELGQVIPRHYNDDKPRVFLASGNDQTCLAQAFLVQFSLAAPVYNASLALCYVLIVKCGWNETKLKKLSLYLHLAPLVLGLGTAIAGIPLNLYGNASFLCWISSQGGNPFWFQYRWAIYFGIILFIAVFIVILMVMVYLSVRKSEKSSSKWQYGSRSAPTSQASSSRRSLASTISKTSNISKIFSSRSLFGRSASTSEVSSGLSSQQSKSRRVGVQGLFFSGAFILTWLFTISLQLMRLVHGTAVTARSTYMPIIILQILFLPLQGVFNFLVYMRPRYLQKRQERMQRNQAKTPAALATDQV